ncbi:hypothetical protein CHS0354_022097 [Potamilus streckersoni]|uniref:Uncharacterized protein n=1 Tax=Potamilus streckersoni TaxID=2493646 RepID=A0AAE0RU85_9BIVA|nr:hypothetical protein CHS0354_022097 [Potamilus streckersoni]
MNTFQAVCGVCMFQEHISSNVCRCLYSINTFKGMCVDICICRTYFRQCEWTFMFHECLSDSVCGHLCFANKFLLVCLDIYLQQTYSMFGNICFPLTYFSQGMYEHQCSMNTFQAVCVGSHVPWTHFRHCVDVHVP